MRLSNGCEICGFKLMRGRYIKEQEATLYEFEHIRTGAELCFMDSNIDNKLFYAAFKTLPFDNTGVFHILEHSVLCGSELYPVKEPFVELLKSSMQTFLNALTFSDKTVYPCSSRNEKDYMNLVKVYLDAVFAPLCIHDEKIFMQEGWHWETDTDGHRIKGVVLNEMKGAMASAESVMERSLGSLLFPDTCYGFNSGGDPNYIPDLTYSEFVKAYKKYYHPSNCRLYLDGSIPLKETLSLINAYLSKFDKIDSLPEIELQVPKANRKEVYYAIDENEDERGKSLFTFAKLFDTWEAKEKTAAMQLLIDVLTDSNSSPLKKAILDKGLGEDVEVNLESGTAQSTLSVTIRNTDKEREEDIVSAWDNAIKDLIKTGIDKEELEAGLSAMEYRLRETSEPRGLYRGISALDSWLYDGDPSLYLTYEELLEQLHERIENDGFTYLLHELLSDAEGMCRLWTLPSRTKNYQDVLKENEKLQQLAREETEKDRIIRSEKNDILLQWQNTPDSVDSLSKLPQLSLEDIPAELYHLPSEILSVSDVPVMIHKTETSGIIYISYYFRMTDMSVEDLPAINFLSALLTELPTRQHPDIRELQRKIKLLTGNISFNIRTEARDKDTDHCTPYFIAKFSTVAKNVEKASELVRDILLTSDFSDRETIHQILLQEKEIAKQNIIMRGDSAGIALALAPFTARNTVIAYYTGYGFYTYLKTFAENFERSMASFLKVASYFQNKTVVQNRMFLSITSSEVPDPLVLLNGYAPGEEIPETISPEKQFSAKLGVKIPAPIGFSCGAWYYGNSSPSTFGSLSVLAKILTLDTLWKKIRVTGGAYGAGFSARRDNCLFCYSYRDPTPIASLNVFRSLHEELQKWCEGKDKLDKYIISTISDMEPLISVSAQAGLEDSRYMSGYTYEMRQAYRAEMLKTDKEALLKWAAILNRFSEEMNSCLVGGEFLIKEPDRELLEL